MSATVMRRLEMLEGRSIERALRELWAAFEVGAAGIPDGRLAAFCVAEVSRRGLPITCPDGSPLTIEAIDADAELLGEVATAIGIAGDDADADWLALLGRWIKRGGGTGEVVAALTRHFRPYWPGTPSIAMLDELIQIVREEGQKLAHHGRA